MNTYFTKRTFIFLFFLLVALILLFQRWDFLVINNFMNNDLVVSSYNADLLSHDKIPYVDSHELEKPPLTFFLFFALFKVFGRTVVSIRILGFLFVFLSSVLLYLIGKRLFSTGSGIIAAFFYAVFSQGIDYGDVHFTTLMLPFYLASFYFFQVALTGNKSVLYSFFSGLFLMLAYLTKPSAAVLLPLFIILFFVYFFRRKDINNAIKATSLFFGFIIGSAAGFLPFVLFFYFKNGLWSFLQTSFFSPWFSDYLSVFSLQEKIYNLWRGIWYIAQLQPIIFWGMIAGIIVLIFVRNNYYKLTAFLFLIFTFIGTAVPLRFYAHHIVQFFPVECLFAGFFVFIIISRRNLFPLFLLLIFLVILRFDAGENTKEWLLRNIRGRGFRRYKSLYNRSPQIVIGSIIKKFSNPSDTIYCWDYDAWDVYFYADRLSASKMYKVIAGIDMMHTNTGWGRGPLKELKGKEHLKEQLTKELKDNKPKFIVIGTHGRYIALKKVKSLKRIPELQEWIADNYVLIGRSWSLFLFARKDMLPENIKIEEIDKDKIRHFILYLYINPEELEQMNNVMPKARSASGGNNANNE